MGKYQSYPEYREGNSESLSRIPAHWKTGQIKYAHSVVLGKMLQSDAKSPADKLLPYLRAANVTWGGVDVADVREMWFSPMERKTLKLRMGDVVISEGGDVGRSAIWQGELPECYFQNAINRARPKGEHSSRYLFYWMRFIKDAGYIDIICNKSTIPHYTAEKVQATPFAFPPAGEQSVIAAFLDHETTKIDRLIAKQERLIELLKEKRQAVISHAVTKGLNPDVPMKDSGVEWLGEVPAHWDVGALKFGWYVIDCKHVTAPFVDDGIPLASIREVQSRVVDLSAAKKTTREYYLQLIEGGRKPRPGDIIYSRNATVGEAALVVDGPEFSMGQDVALMRPKNQDSNYFLYQLESKSISSQLDLLMVGATFKRINVGDIKNFMVVYPPLDEQQQIARHVREVESKFDQLSSCALRAVELLREHRTALISAAVTGKIDVRGWRAPASAPEEVVATATA